MFTSSSSKVTKEMIQHLQQRYLLAVILTCIQLCIGIQCEGECCYWYRRFPATPSVCRETNQTTTLTLLCEVEYQPPNSSYNIEVHWYRSRDEESAGVSGKVLNDRNKYLQFERDLTPMNQTFIRQYGLGILGFNSSDRGYYWCQMIVNNVTLSPSPYGHIKVYHSQCNALDFTCSTNQSICAQSRSTSNKYMARMQGNDSCSLVKFNSNISSTSSPRTTTTSREITISNSPTTVTVTVSKVPTTEVTMSNSSFPTTEVLSTIVAVIILFILVIIIASSIIYIRNHKRKSKEHDLSVHHCTKLELEDISNPHYAEVKIATDLHSCSPLVHEESTIANDILQSSGGGLSNTEHSSKLRLQNPHSEAEEVAQIDSSQIKGQESPRIQTETDLSSEYATVDKSKKIPRLQSNGSSATRADSAMENPQYDKLEPERLANDVVTSKEDKDKRVMENLREKSPSPEYAELSTREKISKVTILCPMEKEKVDCKSDSYKYDKLAGTAQASEKVSKGELAEEVEQHYYYSLENPEESCSDIKGKEEIVNSGVKEYNMPQVHHPITGDKCLASNTDEEAELAGVNDTNTSTLDSHLEAEDKV